MKQPEDIQNRVRNAVCPIQVLHDIIQEAINNKSNIDWNYIIDSKLLHTVQKSIDKLIVLAKAADSKINDETFDIEYYIKNNNINI